MRRATHLRGQRKTEINAANKSRMKLPSYRSLRLIGFVADLHDPINVDGLLEGPGQGLQTGLIVLDIGPRC